MSTVPVIHQTDVFHHHADPDDHWDLASQFALAYNNEIDLKGVLVDYPPRANFTGLDIGDPAIGAIAQLNYITGQSIPIGIGTPHRVFKDEDTVKLMAEVPINGGIGMLLKTLQNAPDPVVIHIVGSCRDVAIAAKTHPELFNKKCKAIYLNAGSSQSDSDLEYNVELDPYSYAAIFAIDCPVYWMPCFVAREKSNRFFQAQGGEYATYYRFQQESIFPSLSVSMRKYFEYALGRVTDQRWLSYLSRPVDEGIILPHGQLYRNMWCTAGFLHTVGKTVTTEGDIVCAGMPGVQPVFEFVPIEITCNSDGRTNWNVSEKEGNRYIFRVCDVGKYGAAMTSALKKLLATLP